MKKRWLIYLLIGILFGVFDFYYQNFTQQVDVSSLVRIILILGVWLVPLIPIILYETKVTRSTRRAALASAFTWCVSVAAYYLTNGVQLAFIGVPGRPEMHISNYNAPHFLSNWLSVFLYDLVGGSLEWLVVAVVGGVIIGFLVSFLYLRLLAVGQIKETSPSRS